MKKLRSGVGVFVSGGVSILLLLALLVVFGVLPVKTHQTTVYAPGSSGSTTTAALTTSGSLTASQIYQKYSAGVVEVLATYSSGGQDLFGMPSGPSQALGSGFVVSNDGYILTNAHVVTDNGQAANSVSAVFKGAASQTKTVTAKVVGVDQTSDVALLKIDPSSAGKLDPLVLGDSSKVQVGEPVVAIGNPLGFDFSLTEGVVSATNRNLQSPNGSTISNGIQTDAAINEGNSGGPLIDSSGRVIGINEQIASQSGGNQGLGFAVPIDTAKNAMTQLEQTGTVKYAWLGIAGQTITPDVAKTLNLKAAQGVLVAQVTSGSPAAKAGITGGQTQVVLQNQQWVTGGDIITAINGEPLSSMDALQAAISTHKPGDVVTLSVISGSSTKNVQVTLGVRPQTF
jgi:putative serine protease PepD